MANSNNRGGAGTRQDRTPPEIRIECFSFTIKKRNSRKADIDAYLGFDEVFYRVSEDPLTGEPKKEPGTFAELFTRFIQSFDNNFRVSRGGKAVYMEGESFHFDSGQRIIYGMVDGGNTSLGGFVKKVDNSEEAKRTTPEHVNGHPYYYLIHFPRESNTGILIFQSFSDRSCSNEFKNALATFIGGENGPILTFSNFIAREVADQFKSRGAIEKISICKQSVSSDIASGIFAHDFRPSHGFNVELNITGMSALADLGSRILERINGRTPGTFFALEELRPLGLDESSEVKIKFKHGGKFNTITSRNDFKFSPSYYVTEGEVEREADMLPKFDSIHVYCLSLLDKFKAEIFGST